MASRGGNEHPWQQYAELIQDRGIVSANSYGFTVQFFDGSRQIEFDGGLTEEHFAYFAPRLEDWDKVNLAQGVLRNMVGRQSYLDWETMWELLREKYGSSEEEWLLQRVGKDGFDEIAREMVEVLREHWKNNPRPRLTFEKPRFDPNSGRLSCGAHKCSFRKQVGGPVWELLCEFERQGFPHWVKPDFLEPDQVKEARKILQPKTPYIEWIAHNDGTLSWDFA